MKLFAKIVFVVYLLMLSWLLLFKFSYDIISVVGTFHLRSFNLIPFIGNGRKETLENVLVFAPFGLLLSVNFKRISFIRKLAVICAYSIGIEIIQFILAIGRTDVTDVITNTVGGLVGLALYKFGKKYIAEDKLRVFVVALIAIVLACVIMLRTLVLRIKY